MRGARKDGFNDHSWKAGVDVVGGSIAAVSSGRRQGLVEIDGAEQSEASQVVLVGAYAWEEPVGGLSDGLKELLLGDWVCVGRGTREEEGGRFGVSGG